MAKFYGIIGYGESIEIEPGIYEDTIVEKKYTGDLLRNYRRNETSGNINDNITISNDISILADPYAKEHFSNMKYVKFIIPKLGGAWKITNIDVNFPRLILSTGGVYNGQQASTTSDET